MLLEVSVRQFHPFNATRLSVLTLHQHNFMDETFLYRIEQLISARAGLQLRPREREALRGTLAARMAALHLRHADEYHQLLQAGTSDAESEWEQLMARLTNNESYFFRDKGQMALLRERILPELIARNQATRTLRLWSAGCSTGEEPYSLAMLVDELLPQRETASGADWEIVILGTDIDGPALEQARRGIYGSWSFRTMEPELQQRCFHRQEDGWQVAEASRVSSHLWPVQSRRRPVSKHGNGHPRHGPDTLPQRLYLL